MSIYDPTLGSNFDKKFNLFRFIEKQAYYINKYGDNYEVIIKTKWQYRKLNRILPINNIKDKKSKL